MNQPRHGNETVDPSEASASSVRDKAGKLLGNETEDRHRLELIDKLQLGAQYDDRLSRLKGRFLNEDGTACTGDSPLPSLDSTLKEFSTRALEVASLYEKPTLVLEPVCSFKSKLTALAPDKKPYISEIYEKLEQGTETITGWRVFLVEGGEFPIIRKRAQVVINQAQMCQDERRDVEGYMTHDLYLMLHDINPNIDPEISTLVDISNKNLTHDGMLLVVGNHGGQLYFKALDPNLIMPDKVGFRPVIRGK